MNLQMSPIPSKNEMPQILMNFYMALKQVAENGKKMTRLEWVDLETYGYMQGELLHIRLIKEGDLYYTEHKWIVNLGDLVAEDWVILD